MKRTPAPRVPPWLAVAACLPDFLVLGWMSHVRPRGAPRQAPWDPPSGLSLALYLGHGLVMAPAITAANIAGEYLMRAVPASPLSALLGALVIAAR